MAGFYLRVRMHRFDRADKAEEAPDAFQPVAARRHGIHRRFMGLSSSRWQLSPADDDAGRPHCFNRLILLNCGSWHAPCEGF
jgi:hypothetical protein